jgi:hypothetical protein
LFYWQGRKTNAEACIQTYKRTCSQLGNYPPQQKIIDTMDKPMMSLSSRSMGPTAIKPLCIALKASTYIQNNMISVLTHLLQFIETSRIIFFTLSLSNLLKFTIIKMQSIIVIKVTRNIMFYIWFLMLSHNVVVGHLELLEQIGRTTDRSNSKNSTFDWSGISNSLRLINRTTRTLTTDRSEISSTDLIRLQSEGTSLNISAS